MFLYSGTHIHGTSDNSDFKVDGVSDKQYPIMLDWRRPEWHTR